MHVTERGNQRRLTFKNNRKKGYIDYFLNFKLWLTKTKSEGYIEAHRLLLYRNTNRQKVRNTTERQKYNIKTDWQKERDRTENIQMTYEHTKDAATRKKNLRD